MEDARRRHFANSKLYPPDRMGIEESDPEQRFGDVEGVPLFTTFADRKECAERGVHRRTEAGIWGSLKDGAYSIVLSGVYLDDVDNCNEIIYTGAGAVGDQSFEHNDNAALEKSVVTQKPVRVIRKALAEDKDDLPWVPAEGLRYDGLYVVKKAYMAQSKGKTNRQICRFKLKRVPGQREIPRRWETNA